MVNAKEWANAEAGLLKVNLDHLWHEDGRLAELMCAVQDADKKDRQQALLRLAGSVWIALDVVMEQWDNAERVVTNLGATLVDLKREAADQKEALIKGVVYQDVLQTELDDAQEAVHTLKDKLQRQKDGRDGDRIAAQEEEARLNCIIQGLRQGVTDSVASQAKWKDQEGTFLKEMGNIKAQLTEVADENKALNRQYQSMLAELQSVKDQLSTKEGLDVELQASRVGHATTEATLARVRAEREGTRGEIDRMQSSMGEELRTRDNNIKALEIRAREDAERIVSLKTQLGKPKIKAMKRA